MSQRQSISNWFKRKQEASLPKQPLRIAQFKPQYPQPIRVRLIPGDYKDLDGDQASFYRYFQHYNRTVRKYQICSSLWQRQGNDYLRSSSRKHLCAGCYLRDDWTPEDQSRIPKREVSTSLRYGITVFVMTDFHLDPTDNQGRVLKAKDDGTPRFFHRMCKGSGCEYCQRNLPTKWGRQMLWSLSQKHLKKLFSVIENNSTTCANCGSVYDEDKYKGGLKTLGLLCPSCGTDHKIQDLAKIDDLREELIKCRKCGVADVPNEIMTCEKCDKPRRPDIFDADFWVVRDGEEVMSDISVTKIKIRKPHKEIPAEGLAPLDLPELLKPEPLALQCKLHGIPSPWGRDMASTETQLPSDDDTDKY